MYARVRLKIHVCMRARVRMDVSHSDSTIMRGSHMRKRLATVCEHVLWRYAIPQYQSPIFKQCSVFDKGSLVCG